MMSAQANCQDARRPARACLPARPCGDADRHGGERGWGRPLQRGCRLEGRLVMERGLTRCLLAQRDQLVAVPLDAAGQRQLDESDLQGAGRQAGRPRQLVDVDRRRARGRPAGGPGPAPPTCGHSGAAAGRALGGSGLLRRLRPARPRASRSIGARASMTSSGSVAIVAPVFSRRLVPSARGSSGWPGTANTSRPCSAAVRAVISVPDRRAASTISTPSAMPEMMRLRRGKSCARGTKPGGFSLTRQPRSPIWRCNSACSGG